MSHRRKAELGVDALAILLEELTFELGPVVRNDMTWDPKSVDNRLEEGNSSTLGDTDHRGGLRPLCEFVDGDKEKTDPSIALGNGPSKQKAVGLPPHGAPNVDGEIHRPGGGMHPP
jgi:hypothetical protein